MIPILTLSEMREAERRSVEAGLTEYELILSAGEAVFHSVKALLDASEEDVFGGPGFATAVEEEPPQAGEREDVPKPPLVAFLCGKGHNGADGLAAALRCAREGLGVAVYHLHSERPSPETKRLREQLAADEVPVRVARDRIAGMEPAAAPRRTPGALVVQIT
jgi:NAD(P)H-hydrate repair Nnr-like enzyme with NAD(P)H-hydrate epimerase domain